MTLYVILSRSGEGWMEEGTQEARSARAALSAHLNGVLAAEAQYVAVPERSWKPMKVSVETKQSLKFQ